MTPLQRLKAEFFSKTSALQYVPGLEGQKIKDDGTITIGDRAGPSRAISNLCHELSHFVEIDDARMGIFGWGLIYPRVEVCGQLCNEPTTMKMTERELRVIAYQTNLLRYLGAPVSTLNLVKSLVYVPDNFYVPLEDGRMSWEADDVPYRDKEPSQIRWLKNRVETMLPEYGMERFLCEWNRKVAILARS